MSGKSGDKNPSEQGNRPGQSGQRIAKVMARAGLASRREAEAWIAAGRVAINSAVIASPAVNVAPEDTVTVDGEPLPQRERTRLFLFHKPRGLVTTTSDPEGRPTIFGALPKHLPRLISIGRLDIGTEGLLLLTNDGGLARVLEHPQTGWLRRYRVRAHGSVTQPQLDALCEGVTIDGIHYGPVEATLDRVQGANVWLTFAIREGKNREVRNVLGHLDLQVNRLIRISFGPFQLAELTEGAIEEVRTRVLRDQLGKKIAALADADFDAPLAVREPASDLKTRPRQPETRVTRAAKEDGPDGSRKGRSPADDTSKRPRPWRGRHRDIPIADRALNPDAPRKTRAGLLTDRKGRRVLVQRVQSEPSAEPPEQAPPRGRRRGNPARDRRHGPRPARPPPSGGEKRR
ncbi:MAG: pseudouridine synthase [Rhizobiales bacterium]|nr:pseudouridine synthase [Hyphomicrobiales bacterium]